jgi:hypothetical protein
MTEKSMRMSNRVIKNSIEKKHFAEIYPMGRNATGGKANGLVCKKPDICIKADLLNFFHEDGQM